jgi:HPt (histidine-containing phosphotransfer) domain-containing protein
MWLQRLPHGLHGSTAIRILHPAKQPRTHRFTRAVRCAIEPLAFLSPSAGSMHVSFDSNVLIELRDHIGDEAIRRVIAQFKLDVAKRVALLPGLSGQDLARAAHALKGSALEVGAVAMAEVARNLEQNGASLAADDAASQIETLGRLAAEAFDALDQVASGRL